MKLYETTAALQKTPFEKVCFILDASESAAQHQSTIIELVRELLSALPVSVERSIYFLGNAYPYAPHRFASQATQWFIENRSRASLVTPIWERLEQKDATIVIIGAGRIFDLADWAGTSAAQRTILVTVGESLQGGAYIAEEIEQPTAQQLLRRLHDPVTRIEISGHGFMPTWWDNTGYQLELGQGEALLWAERLQAYALALRFFALPDGHVQAMMIHASGKQTVEPLTRTTSPTLVDPEEAWLEGKEANLFYCAIQRKPFTCLHCGKQHAWNTLLCREGDTQGDTEGATILASWFTPHYKRTRRRALSSFTRQQKASIVKSTQPFCA